MIKRGRSYYRMIVDDSILCCPHPDSFFLMHEDGGGRSFSICFACRTIGENGVGPVKVPKKKRRARQEEAFARHMGADEGAREG